MMEKLIAMLDSLMESGNYTTTVSEDGLTYLGGEMATDIDVISADIFINLNGLPDYEAIKSLKELSNGRYFATPGETECYHVAGCIHTPCGVVVYG